MIKIPEPWALYLLTYGEAMGRLQACYESATRIHEWQAYIDGKPCHGLSYLPSTSAEASTVITRNAIMQLHLQCRGSAAAQNLVFSLK